MLGMRLGDLGRTGRFHVHVNHVFDLEKEIAWVLDPHVT